MSDKVGIAVYCAVCGHRKAPRGRSVPLELYLCNADCGGYYTAPLPGSLWPGERASEFGHACGDDATAPIIGDEIEELKP